MPTAPAAGWPRTSASSAPAGAASSASTPRSPARDETLAAAAGLAADLGVGVHIHVAEGPPTSTPAPGCESLAADDWLIVHCVHLDRDLPGTIAHNPRSNMNNAVGYAAPARRANDVVLGTDGIGADMLEEFRLAYVAHRADDVLAVAGRGVELAAGRLPVRARGADDRVTWNYDHADSPWHVAFTPGIRAIDVVSGDGEVLVAGRATDAGRHRRGPRPGRRAGRAPVRPAVIVLRACA